MLEIHLPDYGRRMLSEITRPREIVAIVIHAKVDLSSKKQQALFSEKKNLVGYHSAILIVYLQRYNIESF